MKYAQKFELRCYEQLKEYFKLRAAECNDTQVAVYIISDVPQEITDLFNNEMAERGLPNTSYLWMLFKKKWCYVEDHRLTHVDTLTNVCKVSIVLPIEGCEGTHMYWCEGDYTLSQTQDSACDYGIPIWADDTKVTVAHREFINSPTICRVDVPHDTISNTDHSYRIVITTRFVGHPSFDEVCEKLGVKE